MKLKKIIICITLIFSVLPSFAENLIAISKEGNVYDMANAKYVTLNQNNEDVNVIPGMVFKTSEHSPGWYKIEYSPGLHAYIPEQITAQSTKKPSIGNYKVVNNPSENITIENNDGKWSCKVNGKIYEGFQSDDIVVFFDEKKNISYSLIDLGEGPIVINYNNDVTKFF